MTRPRTSADHAPLRRLPALLALASLLAGVAVAATARPVSAADPLGTYTLTFDGVVAGRGGGVGASGGLVTFSGGPGDVVGRLDAAPSAAAQASSLEPGTMVRLVAGQANGQAGEQVIGEPTTARAEFPGAVTEDDATQAAPTDAGPLRVVGGEGRAVAAPDRAVAVAGVAGLALAGDGDVPVVRVVGAQADGRAAVDEVGARVSADVELVASRVEVLDQLVLEDVVGTATVVAEGEERTAAAGLTVGSASVAGMPVAVTEAGVVATGEPVVPGTDVDDLTVQLNEVLAEAGIEVRLLGEREEVDGTRATADSGGIGIRVTTPAAQGVPRNDLALVLGRARTSVFAEPAAPTTPAAPAPPSTSSAPPAPEGHVEEPATSAGGAAVERSPGVATPVERAAPTASADPPRVAPEASPDPATSSPEMVVAGARMSARTAYAGFAAWLLFTSTIPMLGAFWLRRRGLA